MVTKPSYGRDERREYMRAYRAEGRDRSRLAGRNKVLPFRGVDGEGGNNDSGYHAYFLLSAGESSISASGRKVRLTTRECLEFLYSQPDDSIDVVFFGDYDATKILEDLPFPLLDKLMNRDKRIRKNGSGYYPVEFAGFQIEYFPRKELSFRPIGEKKWKVINDVGPFFQCRFVEALEKWDIGTEDERTAIGKGKEARGTFTTDSLGDITQYNQLEIRLLGRLMEKFRAACIEVGIVPRKWQGPGQLAEALFRKYDVSQSKDVLLLQNPDFRDLLSFARNAFYGGRPEISCIGQVGGPIAQWDINSAYPYAMQFVPCLDHGEWENVKYDKPEICAVPNLESAKQSGKMALHFGSFGPDNAGGKPPLFYGLPFRSKAGTITYPAHGRGWYWSFEIAESKHQKFYTEESWVYHKRCDCKPLGFTQDIYNERLRMGKDGAGIILKLALNSLYGKTAQSVGFPKYSNPIWASFITAFCRAMIQVFIHSSEWCPKWCGRDVMMIATDSVCTTSDRTDIEESKVLGGWSKELHPDGIFFVQPGVYFGTSGKPAKTRGVPRDVMETMQDDFKLAFQRMVASKNFVDGDVKVPQTMFVGVRYAIHRNSTKLLGQWIEFSDPETGESGKRISFEWTTKRAEWPVLSPIPGIQDYILTFPKEGVPDLETFPYSKDIGGVIAAERLRGMYDAQPDWAPDLITGKEL